MRVFVTGAGGFIGRSLGAWLAARGHEALAMVRRPTPHAFVATMEECLGDTAPLRERLLAFAPDAVVHLAWGRATNTTRDDPYHYLVNLRFAQLLADLVADELPNARFLGVGSQAEHGVANEILTPESRCAPRNAYGRAKKLAGEYALARLGERAAWLRLLTAYGPGDDPNKLIPYLVRCYRSGEAPVTSPGEQRWDFLHVEDAAAAIGRAAENGVSGLHMLASGETLTLKELALALFDIARARGLPAKEPVFGGRPYNREELFLLAADASSLRRAASWAPQIPLSSGLATVFG